MTVPSYPSIYTLGHAALRHQGLDVVIEEKIDGSQFSFGLYDGVLAARSKGVQIDLEYPDKMFQPAIETIHRLAPHLHPNWTYRTEYLREPKHNVLVYDRIPHQHLILFDIMIGLEQYLTPEEKAHEASRLNLECVPLLAHGSCPPLDILKTWLTIPSCLGPTIEGLVIKSYTTFGPDKHILMGKLVSDTFKETHRLEWNQSETHPADILTQLRTLLTTEARWQKSVQHRRDQGVLTHTPADIGPLMEDILADIRQEETEMIKDLLFQWAWEKIHRSLTNGFPAWYKDSLTKINEQYSNQEPITDPLEKNRYYM